ISESSDSYEPDFDSSDSSSEDSQKRNSKRSSGNYDFNKEVLRIQAGASLL
ncbi:27836_t:CDS:1, partial [Dentiscutata erythropus]